MSSEAAEVRVPFRIVLGDANVLYSRVLRDYLLYAMTKRIIGVKWSAAILAPVGRATGGGDERNLPELKGGSGR